MTTSPDAIKDDVRAHYSRAIRVREATSCCGSGRSSDREQALYGSEIVADLPDNVVAASFGCGNPFAVVDLKPGDVVLDLGSGAGLDVLLAARKVGDAGRVYGLDMTDDMLALAERNARTAGARNVVLLKGDIESIPLPNESVDAIISNCVVNLAPDKRAALREAHRVLRRGGRFAISDIVVESDLEGLPLEEQRIRDGLNWAECLSGAPTTTDLCAMLREAGFSGISIGILRRHSRHTIKGPVPAEFADLSEAALDSVMERFASSLISAVKA